MIKCTTWNPANWANFLSLLSFRATTESSYYVAVIILWLAPTYWVCSTMNLVWYFSSSITCSKGALMQGWVWAEGEELMQLMVTILERVSQWAISSHTSSHWRNPSQWAIAFPTPSSPPIYSSYIFFSSDGTTTTYLFNEAIKCKSFLTPSSS